MEQNARNIAYHILFDVNVNGAYANLSLDKALLHSKLNNIDRRFVTDLVYGSIKMQLHLDHVLKTYCDLKRVDKKTLILLRMAAYQIIFMDKVPEHAAVNEAVTLAKELGLHTDKFINGVLRSIIRQDKEIAWPNKRKQINQFYSKWYSFPQWLIDIWVKEYGFDATEQLCIYFNSPAPTWIRVNTLKTSVEEVISAFKQMDVGFEQHSDLLEAIRVDSLQLIKQSELFKQGKILVQDLSSMLPAIVLNPSKNSCVLDMCAAPGGKTTHLSAIMNNSGKLIACDLHSHRVKLIEQNAKRLGVHNIKCFSADATQLPSEFENAFDAILLDAPCSGLGVLNRRADLRWKIRRGSLDEIEALQRSLLEAAVRYLKPEGTLVYSTCTLNKKENEYQIENFLKAHPDFEVVPFSCLNDLCETGMKTVYPFVDHSDGFFIAKIKRKD